MKPIESSMIPFPKLLTLAALTAALLFGVGLLIYVYLQGGVDKAIYLTSQ